MKSIKLKLIHLKSIINYIADQPKECSTQDSMSKNIFFPKIGKSKLKKLT